MKAEFVYPGLNKFTDEGGRAIKGNLINYIKPDDIASNQYDWFAPNAAGSMPPDFHVLISQLISLQHLGVAGQRQ